MAYGRGAALAMPIVGQFWYNLSIDPKFAKMTQAEFKRNEKIISEMNCPMRLGFSPDKYFAVMRDSTLKDSMLRTGFRGLRNIVEEMYPEEAQEEVDPSDGEGGDVTLPQEADVVTKKAAEPTDSKSKKPEVPADPKAKKPDPAVDPKAKKPEAKPQKGF